MAKREMTGEEMVAFLLEESFTPATEKDERGLFKGSFDWPTCFKILRRKPHWKITAKKQPAAKAILKKAAV